MLKITGNKKDGYKLKKLGNCGMWLTVSTHHSKERAENAMERQEHLAVVQKTWGAINPFTREEKK